MKKVKYMGKNKDYAQICFILPKDYIPIQWEVIKNILTVYLQKNKPLTH